MNEEEQDIFGDDDPIHREDSRNNVKKEEKQEKFEEKNEEKEEDIFGDADYNPDDDPFG